MFELPVWTHRMPVRAGEPRRVQSGLAARRRRRRGRCGQGTLELALLLPLLILLSFGVFDVGSAVSVRSSTAGVARAGLRTAQTTATADVGTTIRRQATTTVPNTAAAWGGVFGLPNGDPQGCPSTYFSGSIQACFAVGSCVLTPGPPPTCPAPAAGAWGTRPPSGGTVIVQVIFRLVPLTPVVGAFTQGGSFHVATTVTATVGY